MSMLDDQDAIECAPSPVQIRILRPGDATIFNDIGLDVFDDPLDARAAGEFLRDPRHHIVVAIDEGAVVGFASAVHYVHPDKPCPELWINEVGVASSHRGRGVGKAIIGELLHHARRLGCSEAWVLTERGNQAAMRLYSAAGGIEAYGDHVMFNFPLERNAVSRGGLPAEPPGSGRAPVNGIEMYYEVHGRRDGVPLVLLHGGGSTIDVTFGRVIPVFASSRMVVALEEQGHGRTTDRPGHLAFDSSADDVAALLRHLGIETADLFGFSNGASVALQVAIRHPQLVRKLVFASAITRKNGAHARMRNFIDLAAEDVRSVRAPTLIVAGDRDIVRLEHAIELTRLIGGARLLILPGEHGAYLGEALAPRTETSYPELTARLIEEFLDTP